jgi:selenocysteine lyase/cysteine desulfurase
MPISRRRWIAGAGGAALASRVAPARASPSDLRDEFPIAKSRVYLNNASIHPMSLASLGAAQEFLRARTYGAGPTASPDPFVPTRGAKEGFAALINAKPSEIAFIPSTTVGEHLVVAGLGIPREKGNVVTDGLHFEGSLYMYRSLAAQGLEVRMVLPREGRIALGDLDALIDRNTKLVALSFVSYLNGFVHDLKAVCDIAHSRGALVYADVIQGAGSTPIDVRASGIDFCACSSYKWLMGDLGLGFLYVREDLLDRVVRRTQYGFRQLKTFDYHFPPYGPTGPEPVTWESENTVAGHFEVGTWDSSTIVAVNESLALIRRLGVAEIQAHNQALTRRLQKELPRLGYESLTPPESVSSIVSFAVKNEALTTARLAAAKVDVRLSERFMRVSPSIYNTQGDIDRLLTALS